ncbi:MAG: TRAP transporter large permease [Synergistaceae bacterium]|jgi:C4-dicarboxylate transporter DctM subunit|nr:TRAP transporter large permease [Synergistaceae bacterium]
MLVTVLFIAALFFNIPIAMSLGVASIGYAVVSMFETGNTAIMDLVVQSYASALDSTPLLALPFFVLAGDVMMMGGISRRLVSFCMKWVHRVPGALGVVTVVACAIFAAISGSGPATAAAIGGIMLPAMARDGYDKGFAAAIVATAGALGPIIPPSLSFIMYGVVAQQSITSLFMSGVLPGILMAVALCIYVVFCAKRYRFGGKFDWKIEETKGWRDSPVWALMVPVVILGGIYGGIFTPTEAAIVAVDYGLIVSIFIYREIKIKDLYKVFRPTCITIGSISIIACGAAAFGRLLTIEQIPKALADFILSLSSSKFVIMMLINVLLLLIGCVMETLSAIIILTPILLAVTTPLGIDPIHFGCIMVVNLVIGMCTPPVGVNLFVALRIGDVTLGEMSKWLVFSLLSLIVVLMVITYVPSISLFLPRLLLG